MKRKESQREGFLWDSFFASLSENRTRQKQFS